MPNIISSLQNIENMLPYTVKRTVYQRKVDVDMLNAVTSVLADVSSVSPLSEQRANSCNIFALSKG